MSELIKRDYDEGKGSIWVINKNDRARVPEDLFDQYSKYGWEKEVQSKSPEFEILNSRYIRFSRLAHTMRYSGLQLQKPESVAEHVVGMTSFAIVMVNELNNSIKLNNLSDPLNPIPLIDLKLVIYKIAIHDLDEAFYCDIPKNFKYENEEIYNAIESTSQKLMRTTLGDELLNDINNAKSLDTREGFLVKLLDTVQAGHKMFNEYYLGNQFIKSEIPNVIGTLGALMQGLSSLNYDKVTTEYLTHFMNIMTSELNRINK